MNKSPHDVQLPLRSRTRTQVVTEHSSTSSASDNFPAEILLLIARYTEDTEDLQHLRLVSRAFSHAATTALQDRFTRIYILPLQSSMARFTRLTKNPLIGPKLRHVSVIYGPPLAAFDIPRACFDVALHYGLRLQDVLQDVRDIMSEYNERYTDSRPADADSTSRTVVESGELERVLSEGLRRLPELNRVFMCRNALCSTRGTSLSLNLPEFLQLDTRSQSGGNKFDAIQHLTVADYVKTEILHYLYMNTIGQASPMDILGALSRWPVAPGGKCCILSMFVQGLSSLDEVSWNTKLDQEPLFLHNSMANLTRIELSIDCPRPPQQLAARLDTSGVQHHEVSQSRRWLALLQAASNLRVLRLSDTSEWSAGFDNLLHLIFEAATWPKLTELSIRHEQNIGLLPFAPQLFGHSLGWYLFLQSDLDRFLVRHKNTLEKLELRNIMGLTERIPPASISLQWFEPAFPDPKPSISAFERSLRLWKRELKGLTEVEIIVAVEFYGGREAAVDEWIEGSEVQALSSSMGFSVELAVLDESLMDDWMVPSGVEFDWGEWLLGREGGDG